MPSAKTEQSLPVEYRQLRQRLSQVSWLALGSLVERGRPGQGGPRFQWSRRVGNKTVTVALSEAQFTWLKTAIANQREVWQILMEMQALTAKYMIENLPNPTRRKKLSRKKLGLN